MITARDPVCRDAVAENEQLEENSDKILTLEPLLLNEV